MLPCVRLACVLALLLAGCGDDGHFDPPDTGDGGPDTDGNGEPDASITDAEGPIVTVVSPDAPASGDFSSGAIVVTDALAVTCRVIDNPDSGFPVDSSSVTVTASAGGSTVTAAATLSGSPNEYAATLDLSAFPNGELAVRCTASDAAPDRHTNSDTVDTFLDLGPAIAVFSPVEGSSYGQQLDISFTVTPTPVAAGDTGAAIDEVTVTVAGVSLAVTAGAANTYFATLDFDAVGFSPPLSGKVEVQFAATNSRTATAVARSMRVTFIADADGPTIAIGGPEPGQVVGGVIDITASVSDPTGLGSVIARIAHTFEVELELVGTQYVGSFDTRVLPDTFVFPLIEVIARDTVGNESGTGWIVTLDNRPPLVDLDPPDARDARCGEGLDCPPNPQMECSVKFDPVGPDAVDDGQTVSQLFELRARIDDQGNGPLSPTTDVFIPHAGVNNTNVGIFLLDSQALPLLVDIDGDLVCDDINPEISPTSFPDSFDEAAVAVLTELNPDGSPFYDVIIGSVGSDPEIDDGDCVTALEADDEGPPAICPLTSPTSFIPAGLDGSPAIYSLAPVSDKVCMGNPFDAPATNIADGWACVAVRAEDLLGNFRVSAPLRVCIDSDGDGEDAQGNSLASIGCAPMGGTAVSPPISCTDGCTPAPSFRSLPAYQLLLRLD